MSIDETQAIDLGPGQVFTRDGSEISRAIQFGSIEYSSTIDLDKLPQNMATRGDGLGDLSAIADWWWAYFHGFRPTPHSSRGQIRVAEVFCGPGGLAQGVRQFCREAGFEFVSVAAVDADDTAVDIYDQNHGPVPHAHRGMVSDLVAYDVDGQGPDASWRNGSLPQLIPGKVWSDLPADDPIDLLLAGPPCQGHSNLNNHSRRNDDRNAAYLDVPAMAVALDIPMVIIENVPAAVHDHGQVVQSARALFEKSGYLVSEGILRASSMGWPQTRSRFFMVARKEELGRPIPVEEVATGLYRPKGSDPLPVWWAIGDLETVETDNHMHRRPKYQKDNVERIAYLHGEGKDDFNLPLEEHNKMHKPEVRKALLKEGKLKIKPGQTEEEALEVTHRTVYGRLDPDGPAGTITTGFMTPGRGRYVHPTQKRTINPHEAARIQGFPDDYRFTLDGKPPTTQLLTKWIGDAVPMPLGYAAALSVLGPDLSA